MTPIDPKTPDEKAESKLREYNTWVLKWLCIHEALPGHYVQAEHAKNIQPISRRLTRDLFGNGAYVEGWAEYVAQVMMQQGFANNDPRYRISYLKVWLRALASALEMSMSCASDAGATAPACVALGDGRLELHLGDARSVLPRLARDAAFDAVFLDPFSPRVEPELWQPAFLAEIARRMAPAALLSTYSSSASVRAALVAAGLRVGPGARVGTKAAGTVASPAGCVGELDRRTARRVLRRAIGLRPPT